MTKTVLIVEDNELNMKLFNDLLETRGCRIVQTRNGVEAVRLARETKPDLILMDIQLPEVSGLEVTQWLKDDESLRSIPVIAVTAFAMKGDEEKILQGGCEAGNVLRGAAENHVGHVAAAILRAMEIEGVANLAGDVADAVLENVSHLGVTIRGCGRTTAASTSAKARPCGSG